MVRYRYSPLPGQDYIRLATIHPGTFEDDIIISFHTSPFPGDVLPYEALSYVWGSDKNYTPIYRILVTRNLDIALRHLRRDNTPRVMWIDALCINQKNEVEKSPQVSIMGEIFRLAHRVIAWLGPEENDSSGAMYLMDYLGSQVEVDFVKIEMRPAAGCTDPNISNHYIVLPFQDRDVYSIYHLMCRQWFDRLWIRQEIYLAGPEAVIMCGLYQVKWSSFRRGLVCICIKRAQVTDFSYQYNARRDDLQGLIFQRKTKLIALIRNYSNTRCLDPRDRLYAVLSLLNDEDKALIPSPDYTQPYDKLYTTVVRNWIKHYDSLTILYQCQLQGDTCSSWVPDWSKSDARFNALLPCLYASPFKAWYEFPQPRVLRVMGVPKCAVSEYHQLPQMSSYRNSILEQIRTLLLKVDLKEQHTAEDYARVLVCDQFASSYDPPHFNYPDFGEAKQCVEFIMSNCDINGVNNRDFVRSLEGCRLIQCTGGYVGIAPASAQPGDEVYTLLGCLGPLLLRPQGNNKFKVIGNCYVLGLAYDEALLGPLPVNIQAIMSYDKRFDRYAPAFSDLSSGKIFYEDPRLKSLSIDLEDFRGRLQKDPWARLHREPHIFRERGVDLKCIDLG
ncbi:HET-domain-containing protein [Daldinia decipiens]|uniref:HET-domain-containing protein n=1 Tax=Daldinia decipiens TaxID=326647 RepID=UPI0020C4F728|nr:HET-domain-containing protein [Daldinia decipiens]KAI1660347.1 HET-domain-containing protein [Daldinia decipiens]